MTTFNRKKLYNGLRQLQPCFNGNRVLPINDYVKVEIEQGVAKLSANNMSMCISCEVECDSPDYTFLLDFSDTFSLLPNLTSENIDLEIEEKNITLISNGKKYGFTTDDRLLFPVMRSTKEPIVVEVGQDFIEALKEAIKHEGEDPRAEGCCVNFKENGTVDVVGTNKLKVFCKNMPYKGEGMYHLTSAFVNAINTSGTFKIDSVNISLETILSTTTSLLLDQPYINYDYPFRSTINPNAFFSKAEMLLNLDSVLCFKDAEYTEVELSFTSEKIEFKYKNFEKARFADADMVCKYDGEPVSISLNAAFLKSVLAFLPTNEVQANVTTPSACIYFTAPSIKSLIAPLVQN